MTKYPTKARPVLVGFGRCLRASRLVAKMSQATLGQRSRVGQKFISACELGQANPSLATIALIADGLGCDVADLIPRAQSSEHVLLRAEDISDARAAVAILVSVFKTRRRIRQR